ncbi:hypothetical protein KKF84_12670, partial [Myxococcota bacterium]|nr:hypothetical protein [Myxococcota bacterium]
DADKTAAEPETPTISLQADAPGEVPLLSPETKDKEATDKETKHKEATDKETKHKEAADKETKHKEAADKESKHKEVADKELKHKEAADREAADKESKHKEATDKENKHSEIKDKEGKLKEKKDKEDTDKETKDKAKTKSEKNHREKSSAPSPDEPSKNKKEGKKTLLYVPSEPEFTPARPAENHKTEMAQSEVGEKRSDPSSLDKKHPQSPEEKPSQPVAPIPSTPAGISPEPQRASSRELIELQKIKAKAHSASQQLKVLTRELEILKARQNEMARNTGPVPTFTASELSEESPPPVPGEDLANLANPQWLPLLEEDPYFSEIVLIDFIGGLYVAAQKARQDGGTGFTALAPYIVTGAQRSLFRRAKRQIESADTLFTIRTIKSIAVENISLSAPRFDKGQVFLTATISAHYGEIYHDLPDSFSFSVLEVWEFKRNTNLLSREPARAQDLTCPACKEPVDTTNPIKCTSCRSLYALGTDDWVVTGIKVLKERRWSEDSLRKILPPPPEGTPERPDDFDSRWESYWKEQGDLGPKEFNVHVHRIFNSLYKARSEERIAHAWPLLVPPLVAQLQFWFDAYQRQNLRHVISGAGVDMIVPEEISRDRFYDIITIQIYLFHHEYSADRASGELVGNGDYKTDLKRYSQRWTLIKPRFSDSERLSHCYECNQEINQAIEMFKCPTCHAFLQKEKENWLLSSITVPKPRS